MREGREKAGSVCGWEGHVGGEQEVVLEPGDMLDPNLFPWVAKGIFS